MKGFSKPKRALRLCWRLYGSGLVVSLLINGCGSIVKTSPIDPPATPSPSPTQATWVASPPGTLVIDANLSTDGVFLPGMYEDINRLVIPAIYAELARLDASGHYFPYLAEELPSLSNGLARFHGQGEDEFFEVEFKLRNGLTWHDGEALTANDLVFSWEYVMTPDWPLEHYGNAGLAAEVYVQLVEAITSDRVVYRFMSQRQARLVAQTGGRLQDPSLYADLVEQNGPYVPLDFIEVGRNVYPEHLVKEISPSEITESDFAYHPVYAGAYRLVEGGRYDQPVVLEAFEAFSLGIPAIQRVVFGPQLYSPVDSIHWEEPDVLYTAIRAGAVQAQLGLPAVSIREGEDPEAYDQLASQGVANVLWETRMAFEVLDFNLDNPHLADLRVRQAIAHAIDRQALIDTALAGHGRLLRTYLFAGHPFYAGDDILPDYAFDPEWSRMLMEEAGYNLGQFPAIHPSRGPAILQLASMDVAPHPRQGIAALIQQELADIGIQVNPQFYSWAEFEADDCSGIRNNRQFDLGLAGWLGGSVYPLWFVEHVTASWSIPMPENGCRLDMANWTGLRSARIDEIIPLLKDGRLALAMPDEYLNLWYEHQLLWAEELASLPLFQWERPVVTVPGLHGVQASLFFSDGVEDTWNIFEWNY